MHLAHLSAIRSISDALRFFQKSTSGIDSFDGVGTCPYDDDRTTCGHEDDDGDGSDLGELSKVKCINIAAVQRANHNLQNLQNLRMQTPARHVTCATPTARQYEPMQSDMCRGQILGVRNLRGAGQVLSPTRSIGIPATPSITPCAPSYAKVGCELGPSPNEKPRDSEKVNVADRSNAEYNLNAQENPPASVGPKKSVKGVKLVGMEGGTLRRPSLQVRDDELHDESSSL